MKFHVVLVKYTSNTEMFKIHAVDINAISTVALYIAL